MLEVFEIIIAILVLITILLFVPYAVSVWHMPTGRRPLTAKYDRFGHIIAVEENPGFEEEIPGAEDKESD